VIYKVLDIIKVIFTLFSNADIRVHIILKAYFRSTLDARGNPLGSCGIDGLYSKCYRPYHINVDYSRSSLV